MNKFWFGIYLATLSFILSGCGTTKGYLGKKLPQDQLTVVRAEVIKKYPYYRAVRIYQVDDIEVGNYMRGWPRKVMVAPGQRKIVARYVNTRDSGTGNVGGILGGAVGGAIAGSIDNKLDKNRVRSLEFNAEAGREYSLRFSTDSKKEEDVFLWIEEVSTQKVVVTEKQTDVSETVLPIKE